MVIQMVSWLYGSLNCGVAIWIVFWLNGCMDGFVVESMTDMIVWLYAFKGKQ